MCLNNHSQKVNPPGTADRPVLLEFVGVFEYMDPCKTYTTVLDSISIIMQFASDLLHFVSPDKNMSSSMHHVLELTCGITQHHTLGRAFCRRCELR